MMAANHFGPFLLMNLLLPKLKNSAGSRVVTLAGDEHRGAQLDIADLNLETDFDRHRAYRNSQRARILFTRSLARRLRDENSDVTANAVQPGSVGSDLPGFTSWLLRWLPKLYRWLYGKV